jgi:methyl-accepting chemotaxis protein
VKAGAQKAAVQKAGKVAKAPLAARKPAPAASHGASHGQTVAAQQARAKGFALDMSMGGPDAGDEDFRESA